MERTCLFTGKPLDENTKIEHTIPKSLCGRIRSNTVTCSEFNEASSKCDAVLRQEFTMILSALAPVLPKEFNPGEIPVKLDNGWDAIKKDGFIDIKKPIIADRYPSGKPKEVYLSNDPRKTERTLKKLGIKHKSQNIISIPGDMAFYKGIPICSNQSVISILKSIICTIDAVLQIEGKELFTRRKAMNPLISFINESVSVQEDDIRIDALDRHYLGIQLADQKDFDRSLSFHNYKAKPFEHVIIFSSNTATKTLDAAWNIFSHEVHGVRLATNWNGPKVCGYIANSIFKKGGYSHDICFEAENPFFRLQKTKIKGFSVGSMPPSDLFFYPTMLRKQAYIDCICYVETNNDQHLIESFRETARYTDQTTLYDLFIARLKRSFNDSYGDNLEQEIEFLERKYGKWKNNSANILFDGKNTLLSQFIHDYKEAFTSLAKSFYPPTKIVHKVSSYIVKSAQK